MLYEEKRGAAVRLAGRVGTKSDSLGGLLVPCMMHDDSDRGSSRYRKLERVSDGRLAKEVW